MDCKYHSNTLNTTIFLFCFSYWSQGSTVFKLKNTIADIWQGIIRTQVSRFNLPLYVKLALTKLQDFNIVILSNFSGKRLHLRMYKN